ncbi:MAG: phosphoribosylanthranilate isomerase [Aureispira sp.]|nr:phosphoribosylanthranilate isomerase [Aureispira sp.]
MKIKVCGMRLASNIKDLGALDIDFVGFIFYNKSSRNVEELPIINIPERIQRVGVFVNASVAKIEQKAEEFNLDYIQLHGDESPEFCEALQSKGYTLFKAFAVDDAFDFKVLEAYENCCTYFLLDAKGSSYGGNGIQFDWKILDQYTSQKPFFLSGGIDMNSIQSVLNLELPQLYGIDVNSKFELSPALKDISKIRALVKEIK